MNLDRAPMVGLELRDPSVLAQLRVDSETASRLIVLFVCFRAGCPRDGQLGHRRHALRVSPPAIPLAIAGSRVRTSSRTTRGKGHDVTGVVDEVDPALDPGGELDLRVWSDKARRKPRPHVLASSAR